MLIQKMFSLVNKKTYRSDKGYQESQSDDEEFDSFECSMDNMSITRNDKTFIMPPNLFAPSKFGGEVSSPSISS